MSIPADWFGLILPNAVPPKKINFKMFSHIPADMTFKCVLIFELQVSILEFRVLDFYVSFRSQN